MASRYIAIRHGQLPAPAGLALVRRLEGPTPVSASRWASLVPRLGLLTLPALCGMLRYSAAHLSGLPDAHMSAEFHFLAVFSLAWIAAIECFDAARRQPINREHTGAMAVLKSVSAATCSAVLLLCFLGLDSPGMASCFEDATFFLIASVTIKLLHRRFAAIEQPLNQLLVVIAHEDGGAASWRLMRKVISGRSISGAIRMDDIASRCLHGQRLTTEEMVRAVRRERVDGVLISAPACEISTLSRTIEALGGLATPVHIVTGSPAVPSLNNRVLEAEWLYLLDTGAQPARSINYRLVKRAFDIAFSSCVLLTCLPLFLIIAAAVKISSRGKIFFVQDRVGWNGRVFRMYKFRTMHHAPRGDSDTRWTAPDDPHRTRVGMFLRRYSLDELPQFLNVLMGEMSVVGPRPERPFFVDSFRRQFDEYHRRHQLKGGITGWAQVNGLRGDTCIRTRLLYDLYYLQNWGLIFDVRIILSTVISVFTDKNAY
jgi:exopolysaccharide biosynthesis polyprenyl glycosylphosphotransferase